MRRRTSHGGRHPTASAKPPAVSSPAPHIPALGHGLSGQVAPSPRRRAPRESRRFWLLVIAAIVALAAVVGSWVIPAMTTPSGEDAGWVWIISAPALGFIGGLVTGYVISWRHVGGLGFAAAFGVFAAAELLVWVAYPAVPDDPNLLPLHVAIPGVPFFVGYVLGAIAGAVFEGPGGAERAARFLSWLPGWWWPW